MKAIRLRVLWYILIPGLLAQAHPSKAQSLIGESCVNISEASAGFVSYESDGELIYADFAALTEHHVAGLTCKDIKRIDHAAYVIKMSIAPALTAMSHPAVRTALTTELAALGIVAGSPAILGATVIGTFGIITVKVLLKQSLEECARQDREALKQELLREMESRYGLQRVPQTTLQITN